MSIIICKDTNETFRKYKDYLKSRHWHIKRNVIIESRNGKCEYCNTKKDLQVHHITYKNIGDEKASDLMVLCAECHSAEHRRIKDMSKIKYLPKPKKKKRQKKVVKKVGKMFGWVEMKCIKDSQTCSIVNDVRRIEQKKVKTTFDIDLMEFCKQELIKRKVSI